MTLPITVLNRLRAGKDVAARVEPKHPGNLAWVYVHPVLNVDEAFWLSFNESRLIRTGSGNPIGGFLLRHLEAQPEVAERFYRSDADDLAPTVEDVRVEVISEEQLATALQEWTCDPASLIDPIGTGYWFARGPQLLWSRRAEERQRCREHRENEIEPRILSLLGLRAEMPDDSPDSQSHRARLRDLAEEWRRTVRHEMGGWGGGSMSFRTAASMLDVTEDDLIRLIDWGVLTVCHLPEHVRLDGNAHALVTREIQLLHGASLDDDDAPVESWWRGFLHQQP